MHVDRARAKYFMSRLYHKFSEDDLLTYAGSLAFHTLLALFPFMLFVLALVTFLDIPVVFDRAMLWARAVLPPAGVREIVSVAESFRDSRNAELLSLGMIGAIWAASGGVRSAINALNNAYDIEERRPLWRRYLLSIAFTVGAGVMLLIAIGLLLLGAQLGAWAAGQLGLGAVFLFIWNFTRYLIAAALLVVVSAVVYSVLPNVQRFRLLTPGSVVAVLVWIGLSLLFRLYVTHFGRYNVLYGSIGAVIVLLLYFWLSAIVLLLGGEINAVLHRMKEERSADGKGLRSAST